MLISSAPRRDTMMRRPASSSVRTSRFRPQKRLQTLHPLKVRNDHAASVTQNVRDHEHFVPTLVEKQIRIGRGRAVGAFGKDAALELTGIFPGNHAIDCARSKNVARQREVLLSGHMIILS